MPWLGIEQNRQRFCNYQSHKYKYLTLKYKYKYSGHKNKYSEMVLEYKYKSSTTSLIIKTLIYT